MRRFMSPKTTHILETADTFRQGIHMKGGYGKKANLWIDISIWLGKICWKIKGSVFSLDIIFCLTLVFSNYSVSQINVLLPWREKVQMVPESSITCKCKHGSWSCGKKYLFTTKSNLFLLDLKVNSSFQIRPEILRVSWKITVFSRM